MKLKHSSQKHWKCYNGIFSDNYGGQKWEEIRINLVLMVMHFQVKKFIMKFFIKTYM